MPVEILVPYLGHNVKKAKLIEWLKAEGDAVEEEEIVANLEAEKAVLEIQSPAAGVLAAIVAAEGTEVKVGELMGYIAEAGESFDVPEAPAAADKEPDAEDDRVEAPVDRSQKAPQSIVVIGGGPGGYTAAIKAAQKGAKVTLIEKAKLGGTCLHTGCMPTKAYLAKAKVIEQLAASDVYAGANGIGVDIKKLMGYTNTAIGNLTNGVGMLMKRYEIEVVKGSATLSGAEKVSVHPVDGEPFELRPDAVIIAAGSVPADIPAVAVDGKYIHNTDTIWALDHIPKRLLIAGSGAVGTEFACIYNALGASVKLVEVLDIAMPGLDREIADVLSGALKKRGIDLMTSTGILKAEISKGVVSATLGSGKTESTEAFDCLLVAAGRKPEIEGLGLERAGVKTDRGAIVVGRDMRTNVGNIYAIGDVIGPPMLAHAAFHEADVAVDNIFGGERRADYRKIAYCVYSYPEVGSVGWTEEQARNAYPDCKITRFPFSANGKAMVCGETEGLVKIIFEGKFGELLGVHIIGEHATELIANFATAVSSELTVDEIAATVMAHPTLSEAMAEAAQAGVGHALHI